jgi:hypothetical protein
MKNSKMIASLWPDKTARLWPNKTARLDYLQNFLQNYGRTRLNAYQCDATQIDSNIDTTQIDANFNAM